MIRGRLAAVFFDLDGTLVDTAPDMAAALNRLLTEHAQAPLAFERIRPQVSRGSTGLIRLGFGDALDAKSHEALRERFLAIYAQELCARSAPFAGVPRMLDQLEQENLRWGIVTNKPGWLAQPLLGHLGLATRAVCVICGDTLPKAKPHPMPLLSAASHAGAEAADCLYIGDDERDIQAGRAAGMGTVAALYGYIPTGQRPTAWGADATVDTPGELARLILHCRDEGARKHDDSGT